ncbi:uncharacterized protein A1O9_00752 [Exophiala aquamarina CBS 119918]|uniref:Major facilitator superfamily (MFS) profile domain-containing protein n=1 Tax=Exophiala aquamarina CBS 119918 TaxID=1182545 RepID=A0A072PRU9_9EURO|nr:uncharacterized protein A1O9_00752 [Exophiala aquamarina CBS 119918]KEF62779.1 hypothetical protein A1O9_00752 [Exophiala aquamarina CBS 119918]
MAPNKPFFGLEGVALSWAISLTSASAFLLFGYDQGIMGSIIATPYFLEAVNIEISDAETISTVVSIYDIGCMVGCLVAAIWGGRLGRKRTIFYGMGIMVVGAVIQSASYSVAQLIAGRIVSGIGNGMNTGTVPTWVSETSKAQNRGKLVATQLSIAAFGIVIAYWMNYGFFHLTGQIVWRFPIAFQIVFALITMCIIPWLPESPRFLYAKGRNEEADSVMSALKALPIEHEIVQAERAEILAAIALEDHFGEYNFKTIFYDKSGQKIPLRIGLVCLIQAIQQLPGVNMVIYYSSSIFLNLGIAANISLILGGVASLCFWLGSLVGIAAVEKFGRKKLLLSGSLPMLIATCIYCAMVKDGRDTHLWVAFACTCVICLSFGWSWLPV